MTGALSTGATGMVHAMETTPDKKMPKRSRSHRLEDESRAAFDELLGSRYVRRDAGREDYGIDLEVEDFAEDGSATGVRYLAQVRGTDAEDLPNALRDSIKVEHVNYYRSLALPVLMVRWHAPTDTLYLRWFHTATIPEPRPEQKTVTFRWGEADRADEGAPARLAREARDFVALRAAAIAVPIGFRLEVGSVGGLSAAETAIAARYAAETSAAPFIRVVDDDAAIGRLVASERVGAYLSGVSGASVPVPAGYDPGEDGHRLAADLMVMAAMAFWRVGQEDICARLGGAFAGEAGATLVPEVVWALAQSMIRSRRVLEALRVAEELDLRNEEGDREAAQLMAATALHLVGEANPAERRAVQEGLARCVERRLAEGEPVEAGRFEYNLSVHHRTCREPHDALHHLQRARELDPGYEQRGYFWADLAGTQFITRSYEEAAEAYARARELGTEDRMIPALHADALMYSGRYAEALALLREYLADEDVFEAGAEWTLKAIVLETIVDRLGIDRQERRADDAAAIAGELAYGTGVNPRKAARTCLEALRRDALSPLPWFNLARADLDRGRRRDAGFAYLAAALIYEGDPEPWVNALLLLLFEGEDPLLGPIFVTADRMLGGRMMTEVARFARGQPAGFPREELLDAVQRLAALAPGWRQEGPSGPGVLRLLDGDGEPEVLTLVPPARAGG